MHVDSRSDANDVKDASQVVLEARIVSDAPQIAFKQSMISCIKPDQGHKQADVTLCEAIAEEVWSMRTQAVFQLIECLENGDAGFLVGLLGRSKTGLVNAVV